MNIAQLQDEVTRWAQRNFPDAKPHQPLLGLSEEVGELCHAHLKMEQGIRGSAEEHRDAKEDAVGDVMVFLMHYCSLNGIDAQTAIMRTWDAVRKRDWTANKQDGGEQ